MPTELAAYAIMRTHQLIGFSTVEEARKWRETNHDWMEFCWSAPLWQGWRRERNERIAESLKCPPPRARCVVCGDESRESVCQDCLDEGKGYPLGREAEGER